MANKTYYSCYVAYCRKPRKELRGIHASPKLEATIIATSLEAAIEWGREEFSDDETYFDLLKANKGSRVYVAQ